MISSHDLFVSVVLSAHNDARWLPEAIESTLGQSHTEFELLLIDDGSTDETLTIMEQYARQDARIRVISHENWGLARALNDGIRQARAEWVARMDADDVMLPSRLERQLVFVQEHPQIAVASCLNYLISETGDVVWQRAAARFTTPEAVNEAVRNGELIQIWHSSAILRRAAVLAVGGYRPEFSLTEDGDLWNRLLDAGYQVLEQPEFLQKFRLHPGSVSAANRRLQQAQVRWIGLCVKRRRRGLPEPTWDEFLAYEAAQPFIERLNRRRLDRAQADMYFATAAYARGNLRRAARLQASSLALDPVKGARQTIPRVWRGVRATLRG
jgi:glycosyltransferase involved in cell wall biosynthesis